MFKSVVRLFTKEKKRGSTCNFDDDARLKSALTRKANKLRKQRLDLLENRMENLRAKQEEQLLHEQIADMEDQILGNEEDYEEEAYEEEDNNIEDMFFKNIMKAFSQNMTPQPTPKDNPVVEDYSEEQIIELLSHIPEDKLNMFRQVPTDTQRVLIKKQYPNISDSSINTAIELINA